MSDEATTEQTGLSPPKPTRYRCTACSNLTRFDVRVTRTTRSFHHYTIGGELEVEDVEVLAEQVEQVMCRWCGPSAHVTELEKDPIHGSQS